MHLVSNPGVLVVSSAHPDPLDQLTKLSQAQHSQQHQIGSNSGLSAVPTGISVISGDLQSNSGLNIPRHTAAPKWFSPNIFKFHLLVHDVTLGDEKKWANHTCNIMGFSTTSQQLKYDLHRAEAVYQSMKMTYGAHACHLLRINSTQPTSDDSVSSLAELWRPFLESQFKVKLFMVHKDTLWNFDLFFNMLIFTYNFRRPIDLWMGTDHSMLETVDFPTTGMMTHQSNRFMMKRQTLQ